MIARALHQKTLAVTAPSLCLEQGDGSLTRSGTRKVRLAQEMPARLVGLGLYHWFGPKKWETEGVFIPPLLLGAGSEGFVAAGGEPSSAFL